jgi:alkylation response protein AidB-like acyl-CoA dehydrogenase
VRAVTNGSAETMTTQTDHHPGVAADPESRAARVTALREGGPDAIVAAARAAARQLSARAEENDQLARYPAESIEELWSTGLWALSIPADRGGIGAGLTTAAQVARILGAADASVALIFLWHICQLRSANAYWPERWWRQLNQDAAIGPALNALRVEPELGTPVRGGVPATKAVRTRAPDGSPAWRINGKKIFSTASTGLRWMGVWVATPEDDEGGLQVGMVLVPHGAPGVEIIEGSWNHLGMRASASNDVVFRDVLVPIGNAIGLTPFTGADPAATREDPKGAGSWVPVIEASMYLGVLEGGRDFFVKFLNERVPANLGAPLASLDRFQQAAGEMELAIYENDILISNLAGRLEALENDQGAPLVPRAELGLMKVAASRNVVRALDFAISLIGNPGLSANNSLQRYYRDALCSRAHAPQADIVLGGAGRGALSRAAAQ